ncbi:hypothetical protein [Streptomyces longispororuber]|uniref:hypothetical protein n=1 Tax=Streptomyces longispororuber TaxID=68230 RepID=UPI0036F93672
MPDLTTAQRLAAYRDELNEAAFPADFIDDLVRDAARHLHREDDGPTVTADLEDDDTPCTGVTHVRLVPHLDHEAMTNVLKAMQERATQASPLTLAPRYPSPW